MPGRRLSSDERALLGVWERGSDASVPAPLRSVAVGGGSGLRGLDGLLVPFRYPVTAICGANGVGKSTVLALCALAYQSPDGWFVHRGLTQPQHADATRSNYTFQDFFVQAHGDAPIVGVTVTWRYERSGGELSAAVTKNAQRWNGYASRPIRSVHFLPLGRIMPAHEITGVRSAFVTPPSAAELVSLNDASRAELSYIMGREYGAADIQRARRWTLQRCVAGSSYTAFNMGGGESCMIALLHLLQSLPDGGMLVVEEIEAGLHPQAQARLAERLVRVALRRRIQIICTTHSEVFLDALPRPARLLLRRHANEHVAFESPSTRFALADMSGRVQPELVIYCEDFVAAVLIEEALPAHVRSRVRIRDVGSSATVVRQAVSHVRSGLGIPQLCVLDGDCSDADLAGWLRAERGERTDLVIECAILPGTGLPPEKWALEQLRLEPYDAELAGQLGCALYEARSHVEAMAVDIDHHDAAFSLARRTGVERADCVRRMMRAFALRHPQLTALRARVESLLR